MKYFVYILESEQTGRLYIGQTQDMESRLHKHNSGYVQSTKSFLPWRLLHVTEVSKRSEAIQLETKLKKWKKREAVLKYIGRMSNEGGTSGPEK